MAAHTVLATVSCSVKLLLKANRKKAKTACWIAGCCTGKGECLFTVQVSDTSVIRTLWRRIRPLWSLGDYKAKFLWRLTRWTFFLLSFFCVVIRLHDLETAQFFSMVPPQRSGWTLRPSCSVWDSEGRCPSEICRPAAGSAAAHHEDLQQPHVPQPALIHAHAVKWWQKSSHARWRPPRYTSWKQRWWIR